MYHLKRLAVVALSLGVGFNSGATVFTVTNTLDSGAGSLRQAIFSANANPGADVIEFNIPPGGPQSIAVIGGLPAMAETIRIDGTTQPGYSANPIIEVTGAAPLTGGFYFTGNTNEVRGLILNNFITALTFDNGSSGNTVAGNWIGLDSSGEAVKGNDQGIYSYFGTGTTIGGTTAGTRNVIAGNTNGGVLLYSCWSANILGNRIGTGASGTNSLGNGWQPNGTYNQYGGIYLESGGFHLIGGTNVGAGNLISGNTRGVMLFNHSVSNVIQGNWMGLNAAGAALPGRKQIAAIALYTGDGNLIGGTASGAGNVLSGSDGSPVAPFDGYGIFINNGNFNQIQGNLIGTDAAGSNAVPNLIAGVYLTSVARTNLIGGTAAGARNVISGNTGNGIYLRNSFENQIQGNFIGTQIDGVAPLGNGESGVFLHSGSGNSIGGTTAATRNVIAYNGTKGSQYYNDGVTLTQSDQFTSSSSNLIRRNSFFGNNGRGIRLYDPSCSYCTDHNDAGDTDFGPNNLQNTPVLTNAATASGSISISGTLSSSPNTAFTLEFFASPQINPTGAGEGKTYIGSTAVVTDGTGKTSFESFFVDAGYTGQFISATATDPGRNTSEFAADVVADGPAGAVQFAQATYNQSENGVNIQLQLARLGGTNGSVTVHYTTSNGTATAPDDYTASSGFVTFLSGQSSQFITIPIVNDTFNEPSENFSVTLDSPTGGAVLGSQTNATVTILDDDPIYLLAGDAGVTKPLSGTTTMYFPITLSQASAYTVSVSYATANITAEAGVDYLGTTGRLDLLPGVTNVALPVTILTDGLQEGSKSFLLTLSSPTNATFGDSAALGTIYDGTQGILQFSSTNFAAGEGAGVATITVVRTGGALGTVSVPFSTSGISATAGSDFTLTNGILTFNNGVTSRIFTVPLIDDLANEVNETIALSLGTPTGTTLGLANAATLTIQDNDLPPMLGIEPLANQILLSWPTQAASFSLESAPLISGATWTSMTNLPAVVGNQFVVTNSVGTSNQFYRLRR